MTDLHRRLVAVNMTKTVTVCDVVNEVGQKCLVPMCSSRVVEWYYVNAT
jgi:hypothetical protein